MHEHEDMTDWRHIRHSAVAAAAAAAHHWAMLQSADVNVPQ